MDLSVENRRRLMTPSGRLTPLVPGPRPTPFQGKPSGRPGIGESVPGMPGGVPMQGFAYPKLESNYTQPESENNVSVPWNYFMNGVWKATQPTGVTPGTHLGITFNANGQITAVDTPPTTETQPVGDNSTAVATTAFVQGQGFITDAPHDNNVYGRQNGQWVIVTTTGT